MDTVAIFSDSHCGSTLGLCPPSFTLDDGGTYFPSRGQMWLWYHWKAYWELVAEIHKRNGGSLYVVSNGDLVDGDHHDTSQIITRNKSDQSKLAVAALEPMLVLNPDYIFVVRGTEAHVGQSGYTEIEPDTGNHSWYYLKIEVGGVKFDIAHHGKSGSKHWTKMNSAISDAVDVTMQYYERGERPPDVIIRSHKHTPIDTFDNYASRLLMLPSFQVTTSFGHKIASGRVLPIGAYVFSCGEGKYTVDKYIEKPLVQRTWRADADY